MRATRRLSGGVLGLRCAGDVSSDHGIRSLERWTGFAPVVGLLLVSLVAALYYRTTAGLVANALSVERSLEAQTGFAALLRYSVDVETAQRGYVITGDPAFLEPLRAAEARIATTVAELRARVGDDLQRDRLERVSRLLAQRVEVASGLIALRDSRGFEAAREQVAAGRGKEIQDVLRGAISELEERENGLLEERAATTRGDLRRSSLLLALGFVVAIVALVAAAAHVRRGLRQRREIEAAIRRSNVELYDARTRAEEADRVKSAFLAAMSHELRTPLNSIIGFTGILVQGLAGPLLDEQARQLRMVQDSARHLLSLINDILDLSKLEARELGTQMEAFDVRAVLDRVAASMAPLAEHKGLSLETALASDMGLRVSDRRRFEQIVLNLLQNAIKFTERGGVVLSARSRGPELEVTVADTGIGIASEDLQRIFDPFLQVDSGPARSHQGTGLGLAISRRLARLLGGELRAESEKGKGSTFSLVLPAPEAGSA